MWWLQCHAHDIAAGQKHELQKQHFVSDQGHTQSTVKHSYSPDSFIIITCVLLTTVCQILEKTARKYFKTERLVKIILHVHGESFISDPFYCPFFKHHVDDYSNFF